MDDKESYTPQEVAEICSLYGQVMDDMFQFRRSHPRDMRFFGAKYFFRLRNMPPKVRNILKELGDRVFEDEDHAKSACG